MKYKCSGSSIIHPGKEAAEIRNTSPGFYSLHQHRYLYLMPAVLCRFEPNSGIFMTAVELKIEAFILTGGIYTSADSPRPSHSEVGFVTTNWGKKKTITDS